MRRRLGGRRREFTRGHPTRAMRTSAVGPFRVSACRICATDGEDVASRRRTGIPAPCGLYRNSNLCGAWEETSERLRILAASLLPIGIDIEILPRVLPVRVFLVAPNPGLKHRVFDRINADPPRTVGGDEL